MEFWHGKIAPKNVLPPKKSNITYSENNDDTG